MDFKPVVQTVFKTQMEALERASKSIFGELDKAMSLLLACKGKIIVTGIGKSGHIGRKISATL